MIARIAGLVFVVWLLGFLWFAIALPQPAGAQQTDAVVVPTGGVGRIPRGISVLQQELAPDMLVSGVFEDVKPAEFEQEFDVPPGLMECCITLGFAAFDTRSNARETAEWIEAQDAHSLRLVTSDWHMRRAALELRGTLPESIEIVEDAVQTEPSFGILFLEYHKLIAAWVIRGFPG